MLSQNDLQQLASYQGSDVLSLYINVDPTQQTTDEYRLALRHLLDRVKGKAATDVSRIEAYFDHEYDWAGRSVALFSAQKNDLWQTYALPLTITNHVHVGPKPYITPLMILWDVYGSYGIALADKLSVKLQQYQFGELVASEDVAGETVRKVKTGRGSSAAGRRSGSGSLSARHASEVVRRNIKDSAAAAAMFFSKWDSKHVLVGAAADVLGEFVAALPALWSNRISATFPADIDISESELREIAFSKLDEANHRQEYEVADSIITAAAKGSNGVIRLGETLSAAHDGRIQLLLVAHGYDAAGYRCGTCGYLTAQELAACPFCSGTFARIPHAVEAMISQIVAQGGEVKMIAGHEQLEVAGVAALLRY